jgi:hypothetical protein
VKISQATADSKPCSATFGENVLNFVYRPLTYTVAEMEAMQEDTPRPGAIIESMMKLLVSWDLTDEDDVVIPLEADALRTIPSHIFTGIMQAVGKDQTPSGEA